MSRVFIMSDRSNQEQQQVVTATTNSTGRKGHCPTEATPDRTTKQTEISSAESTRLRQVLQTTSKDPSRKGSTVSFQDKCELFEIVLEAAGSEDKKPKKPPVLSSLRFYVMALALVSPFIVTYSKTIINFAITDMIHPDFVGQRADTTTTTTTITSDPLDYDNFTDLNSTPQPSLSYFDRDNSCPVNDEDRERLLRDLKQDTKRATDCPGEKFEWDTVKQGLLKAAYSIGHAILQVFGGRMSEIYGSHLIMGLSALLIGSCCLFAPFLANIHFYLMFGDLLLLGILGSFMTPALITLFTNWLTPSEKSITFSFYLVSSRLGYALSSLLCGLLINAQLSWRYLFYSAGWLSALFAGIFLLCARSRPQDHPLMGQAELDYLAMKNTLVREALKRRDGIKLTIKTENIEMETQSEAKPSANKETANGRDVNQDEAGTRMAKQKKSGAPWLAILTNIPVWAFIVTKFCVKLAGDTVQIELPTYLQRVMHFSPKDNGFINASNYVIFCISCIMVGALAKMANKRRPFGWSKTTVRKLFQCTASFGVALLLLGISFSVCQNTLTLIFLMLFFFFTTFGTGGEAQIPLDISERYAGTIHAIGSSLAVSGAIEPILVGFLLRGHAADRDSWAGVWMGASAVAALGGLVFLVFGDASIQSFDNIEPAGEEKKSNEQQQVAPKAGADNKAFVGDSGPVNHESEHDIGLHRESAQI